MVRSTISIQSRHCPYPAVAPPIRYLLGVHILNAERVLTRYTKAHPASQPIGTAVCLCLSRHLHAAQNSKKHVAAKRKAPPPGSHKVSLQATSGHPSTIPQRNPSPSSPLTTPLFPLRCRPPTPHLAPPKRHAASPSLGGGDQNFGTASLLSGRNLLFFSCLFLLLPFLFIIYVHLCVGLYPPLFFGNASPADRIFRPWASSQNPPVRPSTDRPFATHRHSAASTTTTHKPLCLARAP